MGYKKREPGWRHIGAVSAGDVTEARLIAHWASQLLGAVADELVRRKADDSHTNLFWEDESDALVGHQMDRGLRVALGFDDFAIEVRSLITRDSRTLELERHTLDDARRWLNRELARLLDRPVEVALRDYEMPGHKVKRGGAFPPPPVDGLAELGRWYNNAEQVLGAFSRADDRATEMAIWPHHFDLGGIVFLDRDVSPEKARQIGVGMSPGDHHVNRPYFYVTPWPIAEHPDLPELESGRWFTESFTGAVLDADEIAAAGNAADQASLAAAFITEALAAGEALIDEAVTSGVR
jgi:hypothetical protein